MLTLRPIVCACGFFLAASLWAQTGQQAPAAPPAPDVLLFTNGEKLIGHLVRSTGSSVVFKSDSVGEVTVDWSKIKELRAAGQYAVVQKDVKLGKHEDASKIPQGTVSASDQKLEVQPGQGRPPETIPVSNSAYVIDQATFQRAVLRKAGFFQDWTGALTAGASLVEATQHNRTFTGGISLVRVMPTESWLERSNRTTFDLTGSYGKLSQPGAPVLKTAIYHLDAERDEYLTSRVYGFGQMALDHNYSQGLSLQQAYGGGIGWTVIRRDRQELDLKGSLNYVGQSFLAPNSALNQHLVGSTFGENFSQKFARGLVFTEELSATPSWNNTSAYSAAANAALLIPVYKRLSVNLSTTDTFLNNPPPGFRKMSFQFTMGATYTLR
ncbi:MAG TPA: DUF481 domain-containing protein [Bryobacteraceae bacterium]|nr:DUF481 domain-containing protein [Bryobacteraceae bacterium]